MASEKYCFEIFCIDPEDIHSEQALTRALAFSSTLWNNQEPQERKRMGIHTLEEPTAGLSIRIYSVDTSKMLTGFIEAGFILRIETANFNILEGFRQRMLHHLREKLRFKHIRILQDDISTAIANKLYPEINIVENLLRRYLIKFFIQRVGLDWWELTATPKMLEKVNSRLRNRANQFSYFIDPDIEFADFDDLGLLVYKQSTGFNQPEKIVEKLMEIDSIEALDHLKSELQGNYTKYFKSFFRDKNFEGMWKEMSRIRNKVAHHATFFQNELERGLVLSDRLQTIIREAESQIDEFVLSLEEKEAIRQASIDAFYEADQEGEPGVVGDVEETVDNRVKLNGPKVVGKIQLPGSSHRLDKGHRIATEADILAELEEAQNLSYTEYVGLKWFVTTYLANKGYSIGTTYSLVNILIEKSRIDIYDMPSTEGYEIKAIRIPK